LAAVLARVAAQSPCAPTTELALLGFSEAFAYFNDLLVSGIVTV